MDETQLAQEQAHLDHILAVTQAKLDALGCDLEESRRRVLEQKKTLWQDLYELDEVEIRLAKGEINTTLDDAQDAQAKIDRLSRVLATPYFGRIDFSERGTEDVFYIGLAGLTGDRPTDILIYDWRAPVASMFYDFDVGPAWYDAPMGRVSGVLTLRRQYKIVDSKLQYVLDSAVKIDDEILQQELSRTASPRMRNIIATIQREQNRIIRLPSSTSVIVQGVAGSGKTSVALHKVAYLLYNQRGVISNRNLLILSPGQVFSDYISGVLPELGEDNVAELSFDKLAYNEIGDLTELESRYDQLEYILAHDQSDNLRIQNIQTKGSAEFAARVKAYAEELLETNFRPKVIVYSGERFEADYIADLFYDAYSAKPFMVRLDWIREKLIDELELRLGKQLGVRANRTIENMLRRMVPCQDMLELYRRLIRTLRREGQTWLQEPAGQVLPYEDCFPVVLLKYYLYGARDFSAIRHLVVDEMQDYSPLQYAILNHLFQCPKTILGDISQNLNLYSGIRSLDEFAGDLAQVEIVRLNKSFRSTCEIARFANRISPVEGFEVVQRHGELPEVQSFQSQAELLAAITRQARTAQEDGLGSVAILCKSFAAAKRLHGLLAKDLPAVLLRPDSASFSQGIVVSTPYLVKGLEFDAVIVADADPETYRTETDRQNLYVACTRALHRLRVYALGDLTPLLPKDATEDYSGDDEDEA